MKMRQCRDMQRFCPPTTNRDLNQGLALKVEDAALIKGFCRTETGEAFSVLPGARIK